MKIRATLALLLGLSLSLAACDFNGGVDQGRCVAYDPDKHTMTMVIDTALDQHNPHYSGETRTYILPTDKRDMGPEPTAGGRLMVEVDKNMLLYYDPDSKQIKEMPIEIVDQEKNINPKHPKLKGKTFPIVNKEKREITIYSPRLEELVTFRVPESALDMPLYTWTPGSEVRVAFRKDKPGQAIRFMNVSQTNIFTR